MAAGIFILQLVLSLALHKMIGLETMQIAQSIFFVRYLLQNNGPMAVYNMYPLNYINGFNYFASYSNVRFLDSVTMRLGLGKNFIFNVMVQLALIAIFIMLSLYFSRKVKGMKRNKYEETAAKLELLKKAMLADRKMSSAVFIVTTYTFFIFSFGLLSSIQAN